MKLRLFVALEVPADVRAELDRVVGSLRPSVPDARWVPEENLHLTLSFIGWREESDLQSISGAIAGAVAGQVDFDSRLGELGAFPSVRRARILWAALDDSIGGLAGLATAIRDGLAAVGVPQEERAFRPHVTIARLRRPVPVDVSGIVVRALRVPVDRVTLFLSHLGRPAPRYESVATFPFRRA